MWISRNESSRLVFSIGSSIKTVRSITQKHLKNRDVTGRSLLRNQNEVGKHQKQHHRFLPQFRLLASGSNRSSRFTNSNGRFRNPHHRQRLPRSNTLRCQTSSTFRSKSKSHLSRFPKRICPCTQCRSPKRLRTISPFLRRKRYRRTRLDRKNVKSPREKPDRFRPTSHFRNQSLLGDRSPAARNEARTFGGFQNIRPPSMGERLQFRNSPKNLPENRRFRRTPDSSRRGR